MPNKITGDTLGDPIKDIVTVSPLEIMQSIRHSIFFDQFYNPTLLARILGKKFQKWYIQKYECERFVSFCNYWKEREQPF